ncbi:MAG: type II toxin-antitoxin system prevent-host-death family antitoxin [Burkholderiales bacterium]|nr:type II toxin-antitoxin system prevent-host-death family antitoxin [Burkholderiales bacterium]
MEKLAAHPLKARLSELLAEVEKGDQFVITRRGARRQTHNGGG